jgi:hypothetical protein
VDLEEASSGNSRSHRNSSTSTDHPYPTKLL